jgi:hypothetical protein
MPQVKTVPEKSRVSEVVRAGLREVRLGRAGEALHRGVALHPQERLQGVHPPLPVAEEATQPILLRFAVAAALRLDCTASCGFLAGWRTRTSSP